MKKLLRSSKAPLLLAVCVVVIVVGVVVVFHLINQSKSYSTPPDWDKLKANFVERNVEGGEDTYIFKGENITLTDKEVDILIDLYAMQGWKATRAEMVTALLQNKALYHYAVSIDLEPTDEDVRNALENHESSILYFPNSDADAFYAFLEDIGLSPKAFWDLHYDIVKYQAATTKLQDDFIDDFTDDYIEFLQWIDGLCEQVFEAEGVDIKAIERDIRKSKK